MLIKQIKYNSKEYKESVDLRNQILCLPLGLNLNKKDLQKEKSDIHIGCFEKDNIIGTLILTLINRNTIKMRQVAVANKHQGKGIGSMLIKFAEKVAIEHKFSKIIISARSTALNFYVKMGYKTLGNEYISKNTNIPHFKMVKYIA